MRTKINWNLLDGGAFETLVSILLLHEDIEAKTYLRLGPDAGIDVKSSDGKTVYQAKYTTDQENFPKVIARAAKELQKIKKYKSHSHKNFQYWQGVENWCLVTNASKNPKDEKQWEEKIAKPFSTLGLKATVRDRAYLEKKLIEFPSLKEEYFNGDNRVFLSLREAIDRDKTDPIFAKGFDPEFIAGRSDELGKFSDFIKENDKKIILIHGTGGVGKTRFAIEAAKNTNKEYAYDIFWANTATMEKSDNWFQSIISSGNKRLLIIDEPTKSETIDILLEQISSIHRTSGWKFVIIIRSAKYHILPSKLKRLNIVSEPIDLKPFDKETAKELITNLINKSDKLDKSKSFIKNYKNQILKISGGVPIWIVLIIYLLEREKLYELLIDHHGLAKGYLKEVSSSVSSKLNKFLKALAILQPIYDENNHDYSYFKSLLEIKNQDIENFIELLQERGLVIKRGRILEIKPDVIRDYIIIKLIGGKREEAKRWVRKIMNMEGSQKKQSALKQLARIAYYYKHDKEDTNKALLDSVWRDFIYKAKTGSLKELNGYDNKVYGAGIFDLASSISFSNLPKFIEFVKAIQKNKNKKELIKLPPFEGIYIYLKDLIFKLPGALYEAGLYAQSDEECRQVFKELLNLTEKEHQLIAKDPYAYNDGSRSFQLIEGLIFKNKFSNNVDVISDWIIEQLGEIKTLNEDQMEFLEKFIEGCFFELEKHISEYYDGMVTLQPCIVNPESFFYKCREKIFKEIWSLINKDQINIKQRVFLWKILRSYHTNLDHVTREIENIEDKKIFDSELKDSFNCIKKYLSRKNEIYISESDTLSSIWNWNLKYDKRELYRKLAEECENLLLEKSKLDPDLISLCSRDSVKSREEKFKKYSKKLDSEDKIYSFIENLYEYKSDKFSFISKYIAKNLVNFKELPDYMSNYIKRIIKNGKNDHHFKFICHIIFYQSNFLRKDRKENLFEFLMSYWNQFQNDIQFDEMKENFLYFLFTDFSQKSKEDIQFVAKILDNINFCILSLDTISRFAGNILLLDFNQSKKIMKSIFQKTDLKERNIAFKGYIEGAIDAKYIRHLDQHPFEPTKDMFNWLIEQLNDIPSINFGNIAFGTGLKEIKEDLRGELSVIHFVKILNKRIKKINKENNPLWENIFLEEDFLNIIDPIKKEDALSKEVKSSLNELLDLNNSQYYELPRIIAKIDPKGFLAPALITKRIKKEKFLCKNVEDSAPEYEWTRYAGYYPTNSPAWREIAKIACKIAVQNTENTAKYSIFSSLLDQKIKTFSGKPGEVPAYYYNNCDKTQSDFINESDPNIKEFMRWRWESAKEELKRAELENIESNHD